MNVAELGAIALVELGLVDTDNQELTPGMEAVIELMCLAGEGEIAKADRAALEAALAKHSKVTAGREWRLCGIAAKVLGSDYTRVTDTGDGVPRGFWAELEKAAARAHLSFSYQQWQTFFAAKPSRWKRVKIIASRL